MVRNNEFGGDIGERVRNLLEDFEVVGTIAEIVLLPRHAVRTTLHVNMQAAIIASTLGLSSIDYAKKKFCSAYPETETDEPTKEAIHIYIEAYNAAKQYVWRMIKKLKPDGLPLPENGVFGASLVLERLPYSFFSAHMLYRLGHRYEGHAVARLILEQIAWAYAAHTIKDIGDIKRIVTTKAISQLKKLVPAAGNLYGFLSAKTHIDYSSHFEFLKVENEHNIILHAQPNFREYSFVILELADVFGIVWELSQLEYIAIPETVTRCSNGANVKTTSPFFAEKKRLLKEFATVEECCKDNNRENYLIY